MRGRLTTAAATAAFAGCFGCVYALNATCLEHIDPTMLVFLRILVSSMAFILTNLFLLVWDASYAAKVRQSISARAILHMFSSGLWLNNVAGTLLAVGQMGVPSASASIVMGSEVLWAVFFSMLASSCDRRSSSGGRGGARGAAHWFGRVPASPFLLLGFALAAFGLYAAIAPALHYPLLRLGSPDSHLLSLLGSDLRLVSSPQAQQRLAVESCTVLVAAAACFGLSNVVLLQQSASARSRPAASAASLPLAFRLGCMTLLSLPMQLLLLWGAHSAAAAEAAGEGQGGGASFGGILLALSLSYRQPPLTGSRLGVAAASWAGDGGGGGFGAFAYLQHLPVHVVACLLLAALGPGFVTWFLYYFAVGKIGSRFAFTALFPPFIGVLLGGWVRGEWKHASPNAIALQCVGLLLVCLAGWIALQMAVVTPLAELAAPRLGRYGREGTGGGMRHDLLTHDLLDHHRMSRSARSGRPGAGYGATGTAGGLAGGVGARAARKAWRGPVMGNKRRWGGSSSGNEEAAAGAVGGDGSGGSRDHAYEVLHGAADSRLLGLRDEGLQALLERAEGCREI